MEQEAKTLESFESYPINFQCPNTTLIKTPVVIGEAAILINIEAPKINLYDNHKAYELKRIIKDVFLTQYSLIDTCLPPSSPQYYGRGELFISGYICKNIEYMEGISRDGGNISASRVQVPFEGSATIDYINQPQIFPDFPTVGFDYFKDDVKVACESVTCGGQPCAVPVIGSDKCVRESFDYKILNEPFFVELLGWDIRQQDFPNMNCDGSFKNIKEKAVLVLWLKVLQKQQILVPWIWDPAPAKDGETNVPEMKTNKVEVNNKGIFGLFKKNF